MILLPLGFAKTTTLTVNNPTEQKHLITGTDSLAVHKLSLVKDEMSVEDMFAQLEQLDPRAEAALEVGTQWVAKTFFSDHLKSLTTLRLQAGLSQRELGKRIGVSQPQIAKWESGNAPNMQIKTIQALAKALSIDSSELFKILVSDTDGAQDEL